jgi:hypothetical protein
MDLTPGLLGRALADGVAACRQFRDRHQAEDLLLGVGDLRAEDRGRPALEPPDIRRILDDHQGRYHGSYRGFTFHKHRGRRMLPPRVLRTLRFVMVVVAVVAIISRGCIT